MVVEVSQAQQREVHHDPHDPVAVELSDEDESRHVLLHALQKRQATKSGTTSSSTTPPDFSSTVPLKGDRHTFALVHWSGLPKQVCVCGCACVNVVCTCMSVCLYV